MNILDTIRDQFSPELLGQIGKSVGESPEAAKQVLDYSVPALLGAAAAKGSTPEGATSLFNLLKEQTPPGGWSASASGLLGNPASGSGGIGSSFVSSLLGSKAGMLRDFLVNQTGIRSESASSLLGIGSQLLMSVLGRQVATQGLEASGFGQLLRSQIPNLQGFLPPSLAGMLGIGNLFSSAKTAVPPAPVYITGSESRQTLARPGVSSTGKIMRWTAIPLAVLLGGIYLMNRYNRERNMGGTSDPAWTTRGEAATTSTNLQLPQFDTANFTARLKSAIASDDGTPVDLQGANFDSSGNFSATAKNSLSALGNLLSDNPSLKVAITAYGSTAEEAAARANSIKTSLWKMGVGGERITVQPQIGEGIPQIFFMKTKESSPK